MLNIILHTAVITVLTLLLALFSYLYRLYQEKGRQVSRRPRAPRILPRERRPAAQV
jgi:hypothetical protein